MPAFHVPYAGSDESSEDAYHAFVAEASKTYALRHPTARLESITFTDRRTQATATVGRKLTGRLSGEGEVLAIIETDGIVNVYTTTRGNLAVLVGPGEVRSRHYFDDYPE